MPDGAGVGDLGQPGNGGSGSGGEAAHGNLKDNGDDTRGRGCWRPVLIACIVALLVLLIALIPGVLIYPYGSSNASLLSQTTLHQSEEALRGRIAELRQQLGQRSYRAAPGLLGPDGAGMIGPDGKAEEPVGPVAASSVSDLVPLLDRTTVLVLASGPKNEVSSGSGFFIAPDRIVTNRHVVEMAAEGKVFVINETLGGLRPARVLAKSSSNDLGDKDYALLQMEGDPARSFLQLTNVIDKGQQTYAAGFPGFFMETDSKFRELLNGDTHAAPSMVLTQGIVTVFQDSPSGVKLVLHSADISPGNSGGPLVDACGRVVGVNTFIKTSGEAQVRLNFALKSDSLEEFLARNGVSAATANDPCSMAPAQVKAGQ
nr:serine protease [uncultured Cohaesibacter sp.]